MPELFDGSQRESAEPIDPSVEQPTTIQDQDEATRRKPARRARRSRGAVITPQPEKQSATSPEPDEYSDVMRGEQPSVNPLTSFAAKPVGVAFDSQAGDEQILLLLRRHPITQVPWLLTAVGLAVLPIVFTMLSPFGEVPGRFASAAVVGWYLLVVGFILESFLTWFFNVYIVTDERIVDVDFLSLIYRNVSAAKIDNIEDVTATTGGAVQSVFNFGTVAVQTAAEKRQFEFEFVPQPAKVTRLLNELIIQEEREKIEGRVS